MADIQAGLIFTELAPLGGIRENGVGREGSKYGSNEYVALKYACHGDLNAWISGSR
ncbi:MULTISPECIES: hypothetical protein [unclassified Brucella]|uniref:hypothetical protein n=1 Tax=unclassified Brucella TaxID=2632610 RepID=UPI0012AE9B6E|nr:MULTISPECIES: hypothetical protein [unclassified Brucella]MRN43301.1 hypothetical protein [Brucella sp. 09RB8913]MRN58537.1 hypothetical protein [Brucella sp. 09RB8918]